MTVVAARVVGSGIGCCYVQQRSRDFVSRAPANFYALDATRVASGLGLTIATATDGVRLRRISARGSLFRENPAPTCSTLCYTPRLGGHAISNLASVRTVVFSDVRLYREGIAAALDRRDSITVVAIATTVDEAITGVGALAAVIVVDMATAGSLGAVRAIAAAVPHARIVAFAVDERVADIASYAEAGVAGYVPCEATLDDLAHTIELVNRDEALCSPRVTAALFRRLAALAAGSRPAGDVAVLSRRELEVLALVRNGLSNKEIAVRLAIEVTTVKNHVHSVLRKLQVGTRAEAASSDRRPAVRCRAAGF